MGRRVAWGLGRAPSNQGRSLPATAFATWGLRQETNHGEPALTFCTTGLSLCRRECTPAGRDRGGPDSFWSTLDGAGSTIPLPCADQLRDEWDMRGSAPMAA